MWSSPCASHAARGPTRGTASRSSGDLLAAAGSQLRPAPAGAVEQAGVRRAPGGSGPSRRSGGMSSSAVPAPSSDERAVASTSSSVLGMVLFVASESMFFAAFFGAYVTTYVNQKVWPPSGTPAPPLGLPTAAVAILVLSGLLLQGALRAGRRGVPDMVSRWLVGTL